MVGVESVIILRFGSGKHCIVLATGVRIGNASPMPRSLTVRHLQCVQRHVVLPLVSSAELLDGRQSLRRLILFWVHGVQVIVGDRLVPVFWVGVVVSSPVYELVAEVVAGHFEILRHLLDRVIEPLVRWRSSITARSARDTTIRIDTPIIRRPRRDISATHLAAASERLMPRGGGHSAGVDRVILCFRGGFEQVRNLLVQRRNGLILFLDIPLQILQLGGLQLAQLQLGLLQLILGLRKLLL